MVFLFCSLRYRRRLTHWTREIIQLTVLVRCPSKIMGHSVEKKRTIFLFNYCYCFFFCASFNRLKLSSTAAAASAAATRQRVLFLFQKKTSTFLPCSHPMSFYQIQLIHCGREGKKETLRVNENASGARARDARAPAVVWSFSFSFCCGHNHK